MRPTIDVTIDASFRHIDAYSNSNAGDTALRARVEVLLRSHKGAGGCVVATR